MVCEMVESIMRIEAVVAGLRWGQAGLDKEGSRPRLGTSGGLRVARIRRDLGRWVLAAGCWLLTAMEAVGGGL